MLCSELVDTNAGLLEAVGLSVPGQENASQGIESGSQTAFFFFVCKIATTCSTSDGSCVVHAYFRVLLYTKVVGVVWLFLRDHLVVVCIL